MRVKISSLKFSQKYFSLLGFKTLLQGIFLLKKIKTKNKKINNTNKKEKKRNDKRTYLSFIYFNKESFSRFMKLLKKIIYI
jgi:hypothetical protein